MKLLSAFLGLFLFFTASQAYAMPHYYDDAHDDFRVTVYEPYGHTQLRRDPEEWLHETSLYTSTTNFLHPYWRNSYWTRIGRTTPRVSHPLFQRYLEDLYYEGHLGYGPAATPYALPRPRSEKTLCYNYTSQKLHNRVPERFLGCN